MKTCNSTLLVVWACLVPLAAQTITTFPPPGTVPDAPSPPARIEGTLVNAQSGEPVPNVRVTLSDNNSDQAGSGKRFGAVTDADGRFAWSAIPQGNYQVGVDKHGFLLVDSPDWVTVQPSEKNPSLNLKLSAEAVISGRVLDKNGDPVRNVSVRYQQEDERYGSEVEADYRGEFHIHAKPGDYRIAARPGYESAPPEVRSDGTQQEAYQPTYYPSAPSRESASLVQAKGGVETSGIDIHLISMPIVAARGVVTGIPPCELLVQFTPDGETQPKWTEVRNGKFAYWFIPPGKYSMMASCQARDGHGYSSAPEEITIGDRNLDNLTVDMRPEFDLVGRIEWEGSPPPSPANPSSRNPQWVRLNDRNGRFFTGPKRAEIGAGQTFHIPKVLLGKYRVFVDMGQPVWVKAIRVDGNETPGRALDLRAAPQDVTLVVEIPAARISGIVEDAKGPAAGVELNLQDVGDDFTVEGWATTKDDGAYSFDHIPPGHYRIRALRSRPSGGGEWEIFTVSETDQLTRNLRIER
ncbi:MAG TPA: carboxypeptidase-like regulatory domain-containing protein [Verrucomicrobiae bacterium]|nr:carboxypeptidase-like regulatory domain-containing protein [Verrucomicrobiae bacterium]